MYRITNRLSCPMILLAACFSMNADSAAGQNQTPEFIESSSPVSSGGRVVSRAAPGVAVQSTIINTVSSGRSIGSSSIPANPVNSVSTVNNAESVRTDETTFRDAETPNHSAAALMGGGQYPYPATYAPLPPRTALLYPPVRASASYDQSPIPYQIPTLGLPQHVTNRRLRPRLFGSCCGSPVSGTAPVPALQAPVLQLQPTAEQIPSLSIQDPSQTPLLSSGQLGTSSSFFNAPVRQGSAAYQPLIRLSNMQPGTYLGQGIIGQPTAYVDGQPVRNLLRYLSP